MTETYINCIIFIIIKYSFVCYVCLSSDFYRIRLRKIEACAAHLIEEHATLDTVHRLLTDEELVFAREYQAGLESHLQGLAAQHMPFNLQAVDTVQMKTRPNLDVHVFVLVTRDVSAVVEEETDDTREEVIDLQIGDQHIMRYRPISTLVDSGEILLI